MKTLPKKLSELILVALGDLDKAEKHPKYRVDMGSWHAPREGGTCEVCLAGSVMAFELGAKRHQRMYPSSFPHPIQSLLRQLNYVRSGIVPLAMDENLNLCEEEEFEVADYDYTPDRWKLEMILTARALKEIGL